MKFIACCVLQDKNGNCLYWLNILYWNFFHLALENRVCREIFHCIEYIFYHSGFLSNLHLPWNTEFAWKYSLYWIYIYIQDFWVTCPCPEKQSVPWIHCIEYIFFIIQDFWATCACLEKQSCREIFHCIEIFFIIQDFWATSPCPENRVCLDICHCIDYIFVIIQDCWATCACPEKQSVPWIHYIEYTFFIIQDFWATCACPEQHELPWYFSLYWNIFIIQDCWATCTCPENRVCPEIFQDRGGGRPAPDPRLVHLWSEGLIIYYTTVRGPDILRKVMFSGYVTILKNQHIFRTILFFSLLTKCICSRINGFADCIWPAGRSLETLQKSI